MKQSVVAFGEIMLRLTPPDKNQIANSNCFFAFYGGSESNVLAALASLGHSVKLVSAVSENEIGKAAIKHLHSFGVDTSLVIQRGDTMGMYFLEEGFGGRASKVIYQRKHAEITRLTTEDFDFDTLFSDCGLFHITGISFALSETVTALCFRLLEEANARKIPVSFDFNYRSKLWSIAEAKKVYQRVISYVDIVFCSKKDLESFLDCSIDDFFQRYPKTNTLIVREREILSDGMHRMTAELYCSQGNISKTDTGSFSVLDRIGGGDAFAAGVLHGLLKNPENHQHALDTGAACFVLKHTIKGDVLSLSEDEIKHYMTQKLKDVTR